MQGVEMQYSPAYMADASRQQQVQAPPSQQQHQQYPQYAPSSMLPPVGPQSLYENIPFQQRQTAIEVMASQFTVPPQYMQHGDHTGASLAPGSAQYLTSQSEQSGYGQVAVTRPAMPQSYGAGQVDFPMVEQQQEVEESAAQSVAQEALDEGLRDYHNQVRAVFDAVIAGRVTLASEKLLRLSRWLVNSVTALGKFNLPLRSGILIVLGLHHDDETKQAERIELWRDFNLCWEALGQKQKEITEEALRTRRQPADILSADTITTLVEDLVCLCDQLEQYGLVDFEMGIWEEQITHIFTICLDLLPQSDGKQQAGAATS